MRILRFLIMAALACGAFAARPAELPAWASEGRAATIPVREPSGEADMATSYFLPPGPGPFPVVVFSHGRAGAAFDRAKLEVGVSRAQLHYWLGKGVAVVSPVRPGYGRTGGADVELGGARRDSFGRCFGKPDYRKTADASALTVAATLQWLRSQAWADVRDVLLVGQSVGGLATVAAGAQALPGVVGYVNFAGGSGGDPERSPGVSCDPDQLKDLYAGYGRATHVPSLWVYALNDQYWGPAVPAGWHAAFAAGGSATTFVHAPAVPDGDGHGLSRHDRALWAPAVDEFVARIGFPGKAAAAPGASSAERRDPGPGAEDVPPRRRDAASG